MIKVLQGLPASGKTTRANELVCEGFKRINKDDLRNMIDGGQWSGPNEKDIIKIRNLILDYFLSKGRDVVIDDTNFNHKHLDYFNSLSNKFGIPLSIEFIDTDVKECVRRDSLRPRPVGEKTIYKMYNQHLRKPVPKKNTIPGLPSAIICDIDGTLAILDRNPYDTSKCEGDRLNEEVGSVLKIFQESGDEIIFVSGREKKYMDKTKKWIADNLPWLKSFHIYMRNDDDKRKDSIVKNEIYNNYLTNFNIRFVMDDRNQVVDMWRSIGLTVFQVNDGNF